nr:hypothetical protein [Tanacetum cinerariifolium]
MELWVELKRLYEPDAEDQLWTHTQNIMHAPVEWKLYDSCGVHHVTFKDKEIFMLVEKDYPLRKGLAIVMISYKLQVENYSQMASDLILKIYKIANLIEFPLPEEVPTASEESFHCQKKRDATTVKIRTTTKVKKACCGVLRFVMENEAKGYEPPHQLIHFHQPTTFVKFDLDTGNLGGYKYHPLHVITYPLDQIRTDLSYAEEPEAIIDRQDRIMRKKTIPFVKILWRNHPEREVTWETEESIRTSYPYFLP